MLTGAVALPAAPLLAPGISTHRPPEVERLATASALVVDRLPQADVAVVVSSGERGVYDRPMVDLGGLGRPDVVTEYATHQAAVAVLARVTQLPQKRAVPLPIDAACLSLHLDGRWPVVALMVPAAASWDVLVATGAGIIQGLEALGLSGVLVAAGDGAAGLSPKAPRAVITGADAWQAELVDAIDQRRTNRLQRLGPGDAARVSARGWAPLAVLHGATARARLGLVLRAHGAPRGVGYIVAHGS